MLFVHILFWGVAVFTIVGAIILVFIFWIAWANNDIKNRIRELNQIDPTDANSKPNWWHRNAKPIDIAVPILSTFGAIMWVGFAFQVASWIYGWGL